ncbi:LOW QUALITY PROTEIN: hypothetical protein PHMEG_00023458 [Phytophthora megakarya]|uniref:Peptidase A2 domain-containing protein n=1 Tax=Phytophthora megakarya TaxID=4795 RepID=A0A225VGA7_9STRA|nr:LOW QUALITY PROTEIN: hypothetical protein PHMEG_00023458 [Phytophthora megakarya]
MLDEYFQVAMNRFLKEQSLVMVQPPPLGTQDIDMESVGTLDPHSCEYDPDDLGISSSSGHTFGRGAVATAAIGPGGSSLIQRVRISAISDLKEFTGKDMDEGRARAWIGKVKLAFQRDQATEEEKCLTFADRMVGPAKNWHRQLSRTTKSKWADILDSFQTQYIGLGMSVAWQYYHARKRSEETPLDYLYRLNVAAVRAKFKINDGNPKARWGHVDHYIETLGYPELADRLMLLRLADVDKLDEVLGNDPRAGNADQRSGRNIDRWPRPALRSRQPVPWYARSKRKIRAPRQKGSDSENELRRIFLAAAEEKLISTGGALTKPRSSPASNESARRRPDPPRETEIIKIETAVCIVGHPTDRCLYACRGCGDVHEAGECPMEEFYNPIRKWYDPTRHAGLFPEQVEKTYCIYAYVNKATTERGRKESDLRGNTCNLHSYTAKIASLLQIGKFSRSNAEVALDLKRVPGILERHAPGKWFRQAKISGRIIQERAILLLDTGAEISILNTTFARRVGCNFDTSQRQECVGIGDNVYTTEGRTRIKITLAGYLVAGERMDLADGSIRLPYEVGIPLNSRKRLYGEKVRSVILERNLHIPVGRSEETAARSATETLWVTRGERWVPTVTEGPGRICYLVISNIGEEILRLDHRLDIIMILDQDKVPRSPGIVSVGPRRYREWQNLALKSTNLWKTLQSRQYNDKRIPYHDRYFAGDAIEAGIANAPQIEATFPNPEKNHSTTPTVYPDADRYRSGDAGGGGITCRIWQPIGRTQKISSRRRRIRTVKPGSNDVKSRIIPTEGVELRDPSAEGAAATPPPHTQGTENEDEIYYHESGDLSAEDLEGNLAVLPESPISTTAKVSVEDLQVGDSGSATPEEIEKLRQIIWKKQHLLKGKGNALPPAARGVVCDIDVGNAKPIALRSRKIPTRFREKVAGLIKGLLAAEIIRPSTSPCASPIVIVRKSNGVDIRLCIDYKLPHEADGISYALISDLLEDLDKAFWYCSLDMASGFSVVPMTVRAREISAFITPFG